jgi:hypothetical protein
MGSRSALRRRERRRALRDPPFQNHAPSFGWNRACGGLLTSTTRFHRASGCPRTSPTTFHFGTGMSQDISRQASAWLGMSADLPGGCLRTGGRAWKSALGSCGDRCTGFALDLVTALISSRRHRHGGIFCDFAPGPADRLVEHRRHALRDCGAEDQHADAVGLAPRESRQH